MPTDTAKVKGANDNLVQIHITYFFSLAPSINNDNMPTTTSIIFSLPLITSQIQNRLVQHCRLQYAFLTT